MAIKKGIILAGGRASRLHPATLAFGKPFLPVFDKPMIYYPLSTLITMGITEILIVGTAADLPLFSKLLGDGRDLGITISLAAQETPRGIADAFLVGEKFIGGDSVALILGDNFFYSPTVAQQLDPASFGSHGARIFCIHVDDPRAFGVAQFDDHGRVFDLVEKPAQPLSPWAVTGLYLYDSSAVERAKELTPSARGELEITDLNIRYLRDHTLDAVRLARDVVWYDLGTPSSILDAGLAIRTREQASGHKIGCPEEAAFRRGLIGPTDLEKRAAKLGNKAYADYLRGLTPR